MPQLAIVIATLNRPSAVLDALSDVVNQAPHDTEIAVVDQSDPGAFARVQRGLVALGDDRIRHIRRVERGLVGARNCGVAATAAPVVLFLDDDVRLKPGCIHGHLRAYIDPTVGGVVGRIEERVVRPNATTTQNRLDLGGRIRTNLTGDRSVSIQTLKGANMSFRRCALQDAGEFDPAFRGTAFLEDADMSCRVSRCGWSLRYEPGAAVVHLSLSAGGVRVGSALKTEQWRFRNTGYFMRRHRGRGSLVPMALTFGAIATRRALEWSSPTAVPQLMRELALGWREGATRSRNADGVSSRE
jgi:GT2 family glycosyltransferase